MTFPGSRPGRSASPAQASRTPAHSPHAALLIDFDNVTLGVRADLTKELRTLLDSDIIRGKVAVQRAYADWRRYPQYIVPLSESSIDLIFAPAFGTNKKNATDIRLAVDAMELVFARPEIGTFILLSGDSDFSSLVIKLKEYGRYVIGVGIRESASDLLIQNCDEYYSYSDLAGLTREEDAPSAQRDPWELVVEAVDQMARQDDVMRSDRLKQVMQQIDSNFDEKNAGFNRFSKFVIEAGNRGLIRVSKLDNGQYEVVPAASIRAKPKAEAPPTKAAPPRREEKEKPPEKEKEKEEGRRRTRSRRGRGKEREKEEPREEKAAVAAPVAAPAAAPGLTLAEAFRLMQEALDELETPVAHDKLRARMVALLGREDELLDAERFPRLLRQANDAEVVDVRKGEDDGYEVSPHHVQVTLARREEAEERLRARREAGGNGDEGASEADSGAMPRAGIRFRRGSRGPARPTDIPMVGVVGAVAGAGTTRTRSQPKVEEPEPEAEEPEASKDGATEEESPKPKPRRRSRGGRSRSKGNDAEAPETQGAAEGQESSAKRPRRRRSRGGSKKAKDQPAE